MADKATIHSAEEAEESIQLTRKAPEIRENVTIRFAGDSGDGMQLTGTLFTDSTALAGNDLATLPDFPAEIRAPAGTTSGVSGFQIHFSSSEVFTPGDELDTLVAMNPAALKVNLEDVRRGGIIIANIDKFEGKNLKMVGYEKNPLEDGSLTSYQVHDIPISSLTRKAVEPLGLSSKEAERCKNFLALGVIFWLYDRDMKQTIAWIKQKFAKRPEIVEANIISLKAGYNFGNTYELFQTPYRVERADLKEGNYRKIRGNEATALGMIAAAQQAGKQLFYGSYPITPATDVLHELAKHKNFNVMTFQAEDEIAAIGSTIGAAYGGDLAATGTSGPGFALKSEAIGLAVMLELPLVVLNVQRAGPSTGMPTKPEQSDLLQAMFGRNGECPLPVLAPQSAADCFNIAYEAFQIAVRHMTPVVILSEGYLGNSSEPWRIPNVEDLPEFKVAHPSDPETFQAYARDENGARPWALPGTPGLRHRIGGLEKEDVSGTVCYDAQNHQVMTDLRTDKVEKVAEHIADLKVMGEESGDILVITWGGCYGAARMGVEQAQKVGYSVSHAQIRYLNPMPKNLGTLLGNFKKVLIPELNLGQLRMLLRARYLVDAIGLNKVQGKPFMISEIFNKITQLADDIK